MKATELRIGNLVAYEATTHIVCGIKDDRIYSWWFKDGQAVIEQAPKDASGVMEDNPYIDSVEHYQPIPLTEQWLINWGFERGGYDLLFWELPLDKGCIEIMGDDDLGSYVWNWHETAINQLDEKAHHQIEIKHVHQLMNLYHALSGQELISANNSITSNNTQ